MRNVIDILPTGRNGLKAQSSNLRKPAQQGNKIAMQVVDSLFDKIKSKCPAWRQYLATEAIERQAKIEYMETLIREGISDQQQLKNGLKELSQSDSNFFPKASVFAKWCKAGQAGGAPTLAESFAEAQQAAGMIMSRQSFDYSHEIVRESLRATGARNFYDLREHQVKTIFTSAYNKLLVKFKNGESIKPKTKCIEHKEDENMLQYKDLLIRFGADVANDFINTLKASGIEINVKTGATVTANQCKRGNLADIVNIPVAPVKQQVEPARRKSIAKPELTDFEKSMILKFKKMGNGKLQSEINRFYDAMIGDKSPDNQKQAATMMQLAKSVLVKRD